MPGNSVGILILPFIVPATVGTIRMEVGILPSHFHSDSALPKNYLNGPRPTLRNYPNTGEMLMFSDTFGYFFHVTPTIRITILAEVG